MAKTSLPELTPKTKQCTKCGEEKSVDLFRLVRRRWTSGTCNDCRNARSRQMWQSNPKKAVDSKARNYRWRRENPDEWREIKKSSKWKCRAAKLGLPLDAYQQRRESAMARTNERSTFGILLKIRRMNPRRRWCPFLAANPKIHYQVSEAFREYKRQQSREWSRNNSEKALAKKQRRRARLAGCSSTLSLKEWQEIKQRFKNRCAYCGKGGKMTRDHVIPLSKGGEDSPMNIVPACGRCNASKGDRPAPAAVQTLLIA